MSGVGSYCPSCGVYWHGVHACEGGTYSGNVADIVMNRPSSTAPLEALIEEMGRIEIARIERVDGSVEWAAYLNPSGHYGPEGSGADVHAAVSALYRAWRERE